MRTFGQSPGVPVVAVLMAILPALLPGMLLASNDSGAPHQEYGAVEPNTLAGRNQSLETRVAEQLSAQGFGRTSRILILATGDRVYLLGVTPDPNTRQQIGRAAGEVSGVQDVADYLLTGKMIEPTNDEQLRRDVERALHLLAADSTTDAGDIQVQTHNTDVLLRGRVRQWDDMAKAIQAAFSAGAKYVVSDLTVADPGQYAVDRPQGGSSSRAQDYDSFLGYVAEPGHAVQYRDESDDPNRDRQPSRFSPRWVQSAQDRRAQQRLASRLWVAVEGGEDIHVLVQDRQAFLFGRVASDAERDRATQLALSVEGVEHVRNRLAVAPRGWREQADSNIEDAIESELYWNPFVEAEEVEVSVNAGTAVLQGTMEGFGAIIAAIESAFDGGARSVQNQLRVSRRPAAGNVRDGTAAVGSDRTSPETGGARTTR